MARTISQFAGKISKACAGEIKYLSENGAIIKSADGRLIAVNGPTEDPAMGAKAQTILNRERLYMQKAGFAYAGAQVAVAYVPVR